MHGSPKPLRARCPNIGDGHADTERAPNESERIENAQVANGEIRRLCERRDATSVTKTMSRPSGTLPNRNQRTFTAISGVRRRTDPTRRPTRPSGPKLERASPRKRSRTPGPAPQAREPRSRMAVRHDGPEHRSPPPRGARPQSAPSRLAPRGSASACSGSVGSGSPTINPSGSAPSVSHVNGRRPPPARIAPRTARRRSLRAGGPARSRAVRPPGPPTVER